MYNDEFLGYRMQDERQYLMLVALKKDLSKQPPEILFVKQAAEQAYRFRQVACHDLVPRLVRMKGQQEISDEPVSESLWICKALPNLFNWGNLIPFFEVPTELLEDFIWVTETIIMALIESTNEQLLAAELLGKEVWEEIRNGDDPEDESIYVRNWLIARARYRLAKTFLNPAVKRPQDAVFHLKVTNSFYSMFTAEDARWVSLEYADALLRADQTDEAREILENAVKTENTDSDALDEVIKGRRLVSELYREHGMLEDAEPHVVWLVKWFKKHPHYYMQETVQGLLILPDGRPTLALERLGGIEWVAARKHTDKTDLRLTKQCRQCGAREPLVKLHVCGGCQKIHYCSRECHKLNWPNHKYFCKDMAGLDRHIEQVAREDPKAARKQRDLRAWMDLTDYRPYCHALNMHSDRERAHTHMVIQQIVYTPKASSEIREKFRVIACSVFRMEDAAVMLEKAMRLKPGEGMYYLETMRYQERGVAAADLAGYCVVMTTGDGIPSWIGGDVITNGYLLNHPYNPQWRSLINPGLPPAWMSLQDGKVQDAEFDI